jgi:hypothetical protein
MPNWMIEAKKKVGALVDDGHRFEDAVDEIVLEYQTEIRWEAEVKLARAFQNDQKSQWAEPPRNMDQLRFDINGVEIAISDAPVRYVDDEGDERFKPARHSTPSEREESLAARCQHHLSWVRRSEAEHAREREQNALLDTFGLDMSLTWDQMRHAETICWRCGTGWLAGDPFELGHCDRPESQGGTQIAWEHRSCNRSEQDNPVAKPT